METRETIRLDGKAQQRLYVLTHVLAGVVTVSQAGAVPRLSGGVWASMDEVAATWSLARRFEPAMDATRRCRLLSGWRRALDRARDWADPGEG